MKTILNLLFCIMCSLALSAQTIYLEETFENCNLPVGWETVEESTSNGWEVGNSEYLSHTIFTYPNNNGNCFAGNNDVKWDEESNDQNQATSDKLLLPFIDFSESEDLVFSFDYVSGYKGGVRLYYRTENSDWESVSNAFAQGGILEWQSKHIHVYGHVNAPIKNVTEPIQFMFEFTDHGFDRFLGAGVDNVKIYEAPKNNLILKSAHLPDVLPVGQFPIKPGIMNHGSEPIGVVAFEWQIDEGPIQSANVTQFLISNDFAISSIYPFGIGTIPSPDILVDFQDEGLHTFRLWAKLTGNQTDSNPEDNYWEGQVMVMNELPVKHYVYEKFSHHTCSPCYEADLLAKEIEEEIGNIHIVSVHSASNDPMDYPIVDEIDIAYSQRTHPGTILDRRFMDMYENGKMSSLYDLLPTITTPWYSPLDLVFTSKEVSGNQVTLEVEAEFFIDMEGEYRFNIWTLENGIVNYQAGAPEGNDYIHDHVLRNYSGGNFGAEASFPSEVEANTKYTYTAEIDIDPSWNIDSLDFLATVQRFTVDSDNRDIVNSSLIGIADPIIVDTKETDVIYFNVYPNPASQFIHVVLDEKIEADFYLTIYNVAGEVVKQESYNEHQQNYIQFDVRSFAAGNYVVVLQSSTGKSVKKFSVVR